MNGNTISGLGINFGKGVKLDIDIAKFNGDVDNYIYRNGLVKVLGDAHSGITEKSNPNDWREKSRAMVLKKLKSLYAGEFRANAERERHDVVENEARSLALRAIQKAIMDQGKKLSSFTTDQFKAQVDKMFARYMAEAEKIVAIRLEAAKKPKEDEDLLAGM